MEELKNAFIALDTNNDGQLIIQYLSPEEIKQGLTLYLNVDQPDEEVDDLIKRMDLNQNGKIEYNEFAQAAINREQVLCKQNVINAFNMIDQDKNGSISVSEYKALFCGSLVPEHIWLEMFKEVDENNDKEISIPEFQKIIENLIKIMKKQ